MPAEFRLLLTGKFANAIDRDACYSSLKIVIQNYSTNNPGKLKVAEMTRDDYWVAEAIGTTEKVV